MITPKTTLAELQAIAAERGIKSIRLRPDVIDPARYVAELTMRSGAGIVRRGRTVAEAVANALESFDNAQERAL